MNPTTARMKMVPMAAHAVAGGEEQAEQGSQMKTNGSGKLSQTVLDAKYRDGDSKGAALIREVESSISSTNKAGLTAWRTAEEFISRQVIIIEFPTVTKVDERLSTAFRATK